MTSSLNNIDGNMGMRVVYQMEPEIYNQKVVEQGLVYGLVYGDNPISKDDMVCDSQNEYIKTYKATDAGKAPEILGKSDTASYYVMTMECNSENMDVSAFKTKYYVRAYAKLTDGATVYSDVRSYSIYNVADYIYKNKIVNNKGTYDNIYKKILKYVNNNYIEKDYDWGNTIVK